jgi:propanol-preferring alcohol dehydrogenase
MAGEAGVLGIYGFGAAAHIAAQVAAHQGRRVLAFTRRVTGRRRISPAGWGRPGRRVGRAGTRAARRRDHLRPVGALVPAALRAVRKGGTVVCGGIHMSDIPAFPYAILWGERRLVSVANLTRADGEEFLALAGAAGVRTAVTPYPLERANEALADLRLGRLTGAAVLVP